MFILTWIFLKVKDQVVVFEIPQEFSHIDKLYMWTTQLGIGKVNDKTTFVNNG